MTGIQPPDPVERPATGGPSPLGALPDYHVHTARCGHARGTAAEYVAAARERGVAAVGIADHVPLLHGPDPELAMGLDELAAYVDEVTALKRRHPGFVLLGIEADYRPDTFPRLQELLAEHPFDYVIGSVHYLDGWGFDDPRYVGGFAERDIDEVYRRYFEQVGDAAESGAFTILGHLDLVKKFGHRPRRSLDRVLERLTERIAPTGVLVEVNPSGLRKPVGEAYPSADILALLHDRNVLITFGSDAHQPADVARDFAAALTLAWNAGHREHGVLVPDPHGGRARIERRPLPPPS